MYWSLERTRLIHFMMCYVVHRTNVSSFILVRYFTDHLSGDHILELIHILIVGPILYLPPFLRYLTRLGFPSIIKENTRILLEGIFSMKLTRFLAEGDVFLEYIMSFPSLLFVYEIFLFILFLFKSFRFI